MFSDLHPMKLLLLIGLGAAQTSAATAPPASPITITSTRCTGQPTPTGVSLTGIPFAWTMTSPERNSVQTAWQLAIGTSPAELAGNETVWSSGKTAGSGSINMYYRGRPLQPGTTYYWRVRVWDGHGTATKWSRIAPFTTGLFSEADWQGAGWIGYEDTARGRTVVPLFRKDFTVKRPVKSAMVFTTGLGQYELYLNSRKVGNRFLSPGWTDYNKTCLYNTYDVTGLVKKGGNALGLIVGNGFFNVSPERYHKLEVDFGCPRMICLLRITYTDGATESVLSDGSWTTSPSPITFTSIYGGEDYDARLDQPGWASPGFKADGWKPALPVTAPKGKLMPETDNPVTVAETLHVKTTRVIDKTTRSYDFGQNASGIVELKVKGRRGDTIRLTPSELVDEDGRPNQRASGGPYYFTYIIKGEGWETWRPRFSYYGFRYVAVTGTDTLTLTMLHTRNEARSTGSFRCSNDLFNRIDKLIRWAIKSNMQSVITDCPHREKLGWLEQDYLMGASIQYNYDIALLYRSIVHDMMDAQLASGLVPDIAPEYTQFDGGFRDSPEWGSASVILPWLLYSWYGDEETLATAYGMMQRYVNYLDKRSKAHILDYGLGDWYDYGPNFPGEAQLTPKALTATAIYFYDVSLMAKVAGVLHRTADVERYTQLAAAVRKAFNERFFDNKTKTYSTGSQTAIAMPLCVGLVDSADRAGVLSNLIDSIRLSGYKLTAGDVGFHFLVRALSDGQADRTIYAMNNRSDVPGYGFQLARGATSLTESWPALKEVSNNHLMLGHLMEWLYEGIGGIRQAPGSIAYKKIIIDPACLDGLSSADVRYECPYGTIRSRWHVDGRRFSLHVEIPVNTTATIVLPGAVRQVGSGIYDFGAPFRTFAKW